MTKIKKLAGDTVLYGLGNMVPRLLNFLLFPIHTRFFAPEQYGNYTLLMSTVGVLNIIYTFGMETAYFRFATKTGADSQRVFNIAQSVVLVVSALLSISFILSSDSLATLMGVSGHSDYIVWLSVILFIDNAVSIPFARLRLEKRPLLFAFYKIINVAVLTGLTIFFLYFSYNPAIGIGYLFLANLIANGLYLLFFFKMLLAWRPSYDREIFPSMAKYAYPIMFTGLAGMTNEFFSRITLEKWLPENFYPGRSSSYVLGVFGACYKFSVFMNLTVQAFRFAAEPFFFSNATEKNSSALFAKVNHYFIIVCCFIMLAVSINMDILKYLSNEAFWEGINIVPPLLLGYLFLGVYYNMSVWFKLTDRTHFGTTITIAGAVLTIALNALLIPFFGYLGSSWATLFVYFFMTLICYLLGQKYFPIPYRVADALAYILITFGLIYFINSIQIESQLAATGFHFGVLIIYATLVYLKEKRYWKQPI